MARHFVEYTSETLPPELKPLSALAYIGYGILFSLPIIGLVFIIIFSFSDANINRRNYARSCFCMIVIGVVLVAILAFTGVLPSVMNAIRSGNLSGLLPFLA